MPHPATEELEKMLSWVQANDDALTRARASYPLQHEDPTGAASALYAFWKIQQKQLNQALARVAELEQELTQRKAGLCAAAPGPSLQTLLSVDEREALQQIHLEVLDLDLCATSPEDPQAPLPVSNPTP